MKEKLLNKIEELKNSPKTQEAKQEVRQLISKAKEFIQSIRKSKENLGPQ